MVEGNGVDVGALIGMVEGLVVNMDRLATSQAVGFGRLNERIDAVSERLDAVSERVDALATDMVDLRKEVALYHGTVMGHGFLISELDERVARLENEGRNGRSA